jgi:hypothetical protein
MQLGGKHRMLVQPIDAIALGAYNPAVSTHIVDRS